MVGADLRVARQWTEGIHSSLRRRRGVHDSGGTENQEGNGACIAARRECFG